jgi:LPXTG-site transpeptidase (sortase) family protein
MQERNADFKENIALVTEHKWPFLFLFLGVFFIMFSFFSAVGFVPERTDGSLVLNKKAEIAEASVVTSESNDPLHISIPSVGIDVNVLNPQSRDIEVLDEALNRGAVHYPKTGSLVENANVFIFGHSSFLPNVINKNYQAFNNLNKVELGDEIFVDSNDTRYVYRVAFVELAKAEEIQIDLSRGTRKLTLSTCNSFGTESERYIVEALFVGSYLLTI